MAELFHSNLYKTKLTVRTHKPDVTQFLTIAPEARIIITADSSNASSNTFIFGTTTADKDVYVGNYVLKQHITSNIILTYDEETDTCNTTIQIITSNSESINKIASFKQSSIDLNASVTVKGSIYPTSNASYDIGSSDHRWQDMYLTGCNLHFNEGLMHYDATSNELQFRHYKEFIVEDSNIVVTSNFLIEDDYDYVWSNITLDTTVYTVTALTDIPENGSIISTRNVFTHTYRFVQTLTTNNLEDIQSSLDDNTAELLDTQTVNTYTYRFVQTSTTNNLEDIQSSLDDNTAELLDTQTMNTYTYRFVDNPDEILTTNNLEDIQSSLDDNTAEILDTQTVNTYTYRFVQTLTTNNLEDIQSSLDDNTAELLDTQTVNTYTYRVVQTLTTNNLEDIQSGIDNNTAELLDTQELLEYDWTKQYNDINIAAELEDVPVEDTVIITSNFIGITCNYIGDTSNIYLIPRIEVTNKLMSITADELTLKDNQGNFAYLRPTSYNIDGTHLISYKYDETEISTIKIAQLSTSDVLEHPDYPYFTDDKVMTIIRNTQELSLGNASTTSNDLVEAIGKASYTLTSNIDDNSSNASNFIYTFIDKFTSNIRDNASTNINVMIATDSNILNELVVSTSNKLRKNIIDLDSSASNYFRETSNQIHKEITQTSNDIQKYLVDVDKSTSNYIKSISSNIKQHLKISSNDIANYINTADTIISNFAYDTSSNIARFVKDTSNSLSIQVSDEFRYTSNHIDITSNALDYAIRTTMQAITDDINASDTLSSNYIKDAMSNLDTQITDFSDAINSRIGNINITQLVDGPTNKIIRDGIYGYDLTTSNLTVEGNILPYSNLKYQLGSEDHRWRDVWLSGDTIYLGDIKISRQQTGTGINGIALQNSITNQYVDLIVSKLLVTNQSDGGLVEIKSQNGAIQTVAAVGSGSGNPGEAQVRVEYTSALEELPGTSNIFYTDQRARAIASASNVNVTVYINKSSNNIYDRLAHLNADDIKNGTSNKFIVNGIYDGDLTIDGTLVVSNLTIEGSLADINTTSFQTERLEIIANQFDGPALKVIQEGISNVVELYATESGNDITKFVLTKDGVAQFTNNAGTFPTLPVDYKIQVHNNIKFEGTINTISHTELSYINDAASNVQIQIDALKISAASQATGASQKFQDDKNAAKASLDTNISTSNARFETYVDNSSNSFGSNLDKAITSINTFITTLDSNMSSNLILNVSNIFNVTIPNVSTRINGISATIETNLKDYISRTSNALNNTIVSTSNTIGTRVYNDLVNTGWISTSSNIYYNAANIGIGVTNPSEKLEVNGNIKFTGSINEISSNELAYLKGTTSQIKTQFDNSITYTRGYADRSSNDIWNNIGTSSNTLIIDMSGKKTTILAAALSSSNTFEQALRGNSNVLSAGITSYINGGTQSQWSIDYTSRNGFAGNAYYTEGSVILGTSALEATDIKLQVEGDILIVDNDLKRTVNGVVEYYQLERWRDSGNYGVTASSERSIYNVDYGESTGYVGIGLDVPSAKLHVGVGTTNSNIAHTYFDSANALTTVTADLNNICGIFDSSIWTKGSVAASSDARIKKNIADIEDNNALQKIMAIDPKTYNYIDPMRGTSNVYGFIAQQIRDVIPEAVGVRKDVIPNVFVLASYNDYWVTFDNNFDMTVMQELVGKKLCIIDLNGMWDKYTVISIAGNMIKIDKSIIGDKVFVYGAEIDDFHILDKSYIFTLNVCATQLMSSDIDEITKQVEELEGLYGITSSSYLEHI
jgi:hypothetical protein